MEMELKRKELEYRQSIQLAEIEMQNEVVAAQQDAELAEIEARIAEQELSELTRREVYEGSKRSCPSLLWYLGSCRYFEKVQTKVQHFQLSAKMFTLFKKRKRRYHHKWKISQEHGQCLMNIA